MAVENPLRESDHDTGAGGPRREVPRRPASWGDAPGSPGTLLQAVVVAYVGWLVVGRAVADGSSPESLCPFGGFETLWTWVTTGRTVAHTHPANLVLALAITVMALAARGSFCGWLCPLGTIQEALYGVARAAGRLVPPLGRWQRRPAGPRWRAGRPRSCAKAAGSSSPSRWAVPQSPGPWCSARSDPWAALLSVVEFELSLAFVVLAAVLVAVLRRPPAVLPLRLPARCRAGTHRARRRRWPSSATPRRAWAATCAPGRVRWRFRWTGAPGSPTPSASAASSAWPPARAREALGVSVALPWPAPRAPVVASRPSQPQRSRSDDRRTTPVAAEHAAAARPVARRAHVAPGSTPGVSPPSPRPSSPCSSPAGVVVAAQATGTWATTGPRRAHRVRRRDGQGARSGRATRVADAPPAVARTTSRAG